MDMAPLVATLTSALAIGLTIVLVRLTRAERQRSDARVAALVTLAAQPAAPAFDPPLRLEPRASVAQTGAVAQAFRPAKQPAVVQALRPATPPPARVSAASIDIFRDTAPAIAPAPSELFEPAVPRTGSHLLYIGAGALVMVTLIAMGFRWAVSSAPSAITETSAAIDATAPAATAQPLSLLALRHEQGTDGTLVISGIVSNPAGAIARERVFAAASLLDGTGALVATARAPLDFTTLAPGEESPFVVRVAAAAGVARYRIGFRDAEGNAVPHLDKR